MALTAWRPDDDDDEIEDLVEKEKPIFILPPREGKRARPSRLMEAGPLALDIVERAMLASLFDVPHEWALEYVEARLTRLPKRKPQ